MPVVGATKERPRRWGRDQIIERIRAWEGETGDPPVQTDWNPARCRSLALKAAETARGHIARAERFETGEWPSTWVVVRDFGSFNAALVAAGFEPRSTGRQPRADRPNLGQRLPVPTSADGIKTLVKGVFEAALANDNLALRGALYDLAAGAIGWADALPDEEAA